jgi:hypothetical protein
MQSIDSQLQHPKADSRYQILFSMRLRRHATLYHPLANIHTQPTLLPFCTAVGNLPHCIRARVTVPVGGRMELLSWADCAVRMLVPDHVIRKTTRP